MSLSFKKQESIKRNWSIYRLRGMQASYKTISENIEEELVTDALAQVEEILELVISSIKKPDSSKLEPSSKK